MKGRFAESGRHTAFFLWYAGEDEEAYYIVEDWIVEKQAYRVPKNSGMKLLVEPRAPSSHKSEWSSMHVSRGVRYEDGWTHPESPTF
jgi:hypothetical protein